MAIDQFPSDGQAPVALQPAPQQRQMITEVLSTETFEFPRERGTPPPPAATPSAAQAQPAVTQQTPAPAPVAALLHNEKTYAEIDSEYFSIDLPSGFQFYDFKNISARTLLAAHQAKFSRAHKEQKLRYTVEGISATLEPTRSAFDLSIADFYFLMYWQKVNSYSKNPLLVTAFCDNTDHNEKVYIGYEEGEEVDDADHPGEKKTVKVLKRLGEETLKTEVLLNNTTLETKYLDPVDFSQHPIRNKYGLHIETMRDVVEVTEYLIDNDATEEDLFLIKYAVFVKRREGCSTLRQRMDVVAKMPPDDMEEFDRYIDAVTAYGVSEFAMIKCKGCGASSKVKITLDALMFLPSGR
jgi:hypothetical protein